ncbi:MAG: ATP-binding protein [Fibrobacteraceae bacterium]|nr:ATP-binding protein [Fibrobacteraceae bacterium]
MSFERLILKNLREWRNSPYRKPLVLRGARQTGKTTLIKEFGKEFSTFIYLNLEKAEDSSIFENSLSARDLFQYICLEKNVQRQGDTLLFIDEIQNSPKAVEILRYFYEEIPDLFVISAGSLLEVMMDRHKISFPVGRVEYRYLFPLNFEEFLMALGEKSLLKFYREKEIPALAHHKLDSLFNLYSFIGGMPEVVARYVDTRNIPDLSPVYNNLLTAYKDDATKYAKSVDEANIIRHIIESAPSENGKRIKFERFGKSNYKSKDVGEVLRKLERAMLLYMRYPVTGYEIPLVEDKKLHPRLQFLDCGLLNHALGMTSAYFVKSKASDEYRGMLSEQVVGQEILASNFECLQKPMLWVKEKKQSNAEVDFLQVNKGIIIPIEVKSGATGTLRSLHSFIDESDCKFAIRLFNNERSMENATTPMGRKQYTLLNLPLYYAGKLKFIINSSMM